MRTKGTKNKCKSWTETYLERVRHDLSIRWLQIVNNEWKVPKKRTPISFSQDPEIATIKDDKMVRNKGRKFWEFNPSEQIGFPKNKAFPVWRDIYKISILGLVSSEEVAWGQTTELFEPLQSVGKCFPHGA